MTSKLEEGIHKYLFYDGNWDVKSESARIAFKAGAKWLLDEARKQKDDPDYKDGGYLIKEVLISLDRLEKLIGEE